jgi:peptide-methionine (S)-S-oxide reductase
MVSRQYRSLIFYANDDQKQTALAYVGQLKKAKVFSRPIVTQVVPLKAFFPAEEYHQKFLERHPDYPDCVHNDLPRQRELQNSFPISIRDSEYTSVALYREAASRLSDSPRF